MPTKTDENRLQALFQAIEDLQRAARDFSAHSDTAAWDRLQAAARMFTWSEERVKEMP